MTPDPVLRLYQARLAFSLPALSVLVATIAVSALPIPLPWGIIPDLPLLFLLVWGVLQPRLVPVWVALLLGVVADSAEGLPVGVNTLVFPLCIVIIGVTLTRFQSRSHFVDWITATVVVTLVMLLEWQLMAFLQQPTTLLPLLAQGLVTTLAFPAVVRASVWIERQMMDIAG